MPHVQNIKLFSDLLRAMVDAPESLVIEVASSRDLGTMMRVKAPASEIGRLIGINGRSARALRTIFAAVGMASGERYSLDIAGEEPVTLPAPRRERI